MTRLILAILFLINIIILSLSISCKPGLTPYYYTQIPSTQMMIRHISVWIDKDFGAEDLILIDNAIMQWNYVLNGNIKIEIVSTKFDMELEIIKRAESEGWIILKIDDMNPMIAGQDHKRTLAFVNEIGGNIIHIVRPRLQNEWMTGVVMHEIGHLLGADHDEVYLMSPSFNWEYYRCIDYKSMIRVAKYNGLLLETMNYCKFGEIKN